jgi:hypothetical protein
MKGATLYISIYVAPIDLKMGTKINPFPNTNISSLTMLVPTVFHFNLPVMAMYAKQTNNIATSIPPP